MSDTALGIATLVISSVALVFVLFVLWRLWQTRLSRPMITEVA